MGKSKRVQLFTEALRIAGYRPTVDKDEDVLFMAEGLPLFLHVEEDDEDFVGVLAMGFWSLDSKEETDKAYRVANKVSEDLKVVKIIVLDEQHNMAVMGEMFGSPMEICPFLPRIAGSVVNGVRKFGKAMRA